MCLKVFKQALIQSRGNISMDKYNCQPAIFWLNSIRYREKSIDFQPIGSIACEIRVVGAFFWVESSLTEFTGIGSFSKCGDGDPLIGVGVGDVWILLLETISFVVLVINEKNFEPLSKNNRPPQIQRKMMKRNLFFKRNAKNIRTIW